MAKHDSEFREKEEKKHLKAKMLPTKSAQ